MILVKNFFSLAGAEAFSKLITFAAFAYLARVFGASGFGYIEWAGAALMCASLIVDQGFSSYGIREIAKSPDQTAKFVTEIVTARFAFAALAYLALAVFALGFTSDPALRNLVLVYGLSLWLSPLLLYWVFQGHDRMKPVAVGQLIRQTVFALVIFVFVRSGQDLLMVGAAEVAAVFCAALFSLWIYQRIFPERKKIRPALSAGLIREGLPIGLSQMFWVVKMFGATFIIGLVATAEDTGYFAGAMRIYIALHTFVWLYFINLLPSLSRASKQADGSFSRLIGSSLRVVIPVGAAVAAVWVWAAPAAMTTAYGQDFANGGGALRWLAGACLAAAVSGHFRFGLIAAGFQNKEMWGSAAGAAAAVILIPAGYLKAGTSGAAAGLCFAEFLVLLIVWLISRRKLFASDPVPADNNGFQKLPQATR